MVKAIFTSPNVDFHYSVKQLVLPPNISVLYLSSLTHLLSNKLVNTVFNRCAKQIILRVSGNKLMTFDPASDTTHEILLGIENFISCTRITQIPTLS